MRVRNRRSESYSPARKRMRLSSPTFDDQVAELSQDDINAFDCLDAQLSQSCVASASRPLPFEDDENPFRADNPCQTIDTLQTERIHPAFMSASAIDRAFKSSSLANEPSDDEESPDDAPPDVDYAAWFQSDTPVTSVGFSTAGTVMPGFQRPSVTGECTKAFLIPSAAALRAAEEKMKTWQRNLDDVPDTHDKPEPPHSIQAVSPSQATFTPARNAFSSIQAPETPTPASLFRSANADPTLVLQSCSLKSLGSKLKAKPFKSPFITATTSTMQRRHVQAPSISSPLRNSHSSANAPSQVMTAISPLRPSSVVNHVMSQKPLGFTPKRSTIATRPKFVTPFKSGAARAFTVENIKPQTPSNLKTIADRIYPPSVPLPRSSKQIVGGKVFDLHPPLGRRTLVMSALRPQAYSAKQLEDMGINLKELGQANPRTAPFYAFATRSRLISEPFDPSSSVALGRTAVLEELHANGCTLAKQPWVDNHWPLILWKLAGMVALDPTSESDPCRKRWCWPEVIRQFMYRYERDLNSSSRPPFRLITTRDASVESPMVLCISDIILPASGAEGTTELEVTDGWYRLRARIDAPLARAVRKGKIKIGRKIAAVGAKLSAERKEGSEILEAYSSNVLLLTGNSTHMAPWHAKLGFQRSPFIATLYSLTADGGNVAVMMLTVVKAYPIAYIEFMEGTDGRKERNGPYDAKEEAKLSTQWKTKRESRASKLWSEYDKRKDRLYEVAERLEQRTGSEFRPNPDDGPPDKIYDLYDTLQEDAEAAKSVMTSISRENAGWLARHIREKLVQEHDGVSREIDQELESICPSRNVKAFCVVVARDTRTYKRPSKLTAQITVWDVPGLSESEGSSQSPFVPGQRYLVSPRLIDCSSSLTYPCWAMAIRQVTNLVPTQASAWMDRWSLGGELYLSTRKNSKWTLIN